MFTLTPPPDDELRRQMVRAIWLGFCALAFILILKVFTTVFPRGLPAVFNPELPVETREVRR